MKKEERKGLIYVLHNLVNDKEYVGQTIREAEVRWASHINAAFCRNDQRPLYRAIRKYGLENFTAEVVWNGPESKLNAAEKRFIRHRKTFIDNGWGYNLTTGGGQYRLSRQSIRKIAAAARLQFSTKAARRKLTTQAVLRWTREDYRATVTKSVRGRSPSALTRKKLARTTASSWKSGAVRRRRVRGLKRAWTVPERRIKHSTTVAKHSWANKPKEPRVIKQPNKSYPKSEAAKKKMGKASKARWKNPAYRKRISKMRKLRWAERRERLANAT
jgi:group I intron endonuclease